MNRQAESLFKKISNSQRSFMPVSTVLDSESVLNLVFASIFQQQRRKTTNKQKIGTHYYSAVNVKNKNRNKKKTDENDKNESRKSGSRKKKALGNPRKRKS